MYGADGRVYFLSRLEPVYAEISSGFLDFMTELVNRDYKLVDWMNATEMQSYEW